MQRYDEAAGIRRNGDGNAGSDIGSDMDSNLHSSMDTMDSDYDGSTAISNDNVGSDRGSQWLYLYFGSQRIR